MTRARLRRLTALAPRGKQIRLGDELCGLPGLPPDQAAPILAAYLLDPRGGAIVDRDPETTAWIDGSPLMERLAPGAGAPLRDDLAAVVAARALLGDEGLAAETVKRRFTLRADYAVAAALASLPPQLVLRELRTLAEQPGPDEDTLHLSLLQVGLALSWCEVDGPLVAGVVERLLALLVPASVEPLLLAVGEALGPIAARQSSLGARVRAEVQRILGEAMRVVEPARSDGSFLSEFRKLDRGGDGEASYYRTLPQRQLAEACARILGHAAAGQPDLRAAVVDAWDERPLLPAFLEGLVAAAAVEPLTALCRELLAEPAPESHLMALAVMEELPLDGLAQRVLDGLRDPDPGLRCAALAALTLLPDDVALPALADLEGDDDPDVSACLGAALRDFGRLDLVAARKLPARSAGGLRRLCAAAVRAYLPDPSHAVIAELVSAIGDQLEEEEAAREDALAAGDADAGDDSDDSDLAQAPLCEALAHVLRTTPQGVQRTTQLLQEMPAALPVLTLVLCATDWRPERVGVRLPDALRQPLDAALGELVGDDDESTLMVLQILCRFSHGDRRLATRVLDVLERMEGGGLELLGALADLGVRSQRAGDALEPLTNENEEVMARTVAAGVAGLVAPVEHPLWARVRPLVELGTIAGASAYAALAHRVRLESSDGEAT